MNLNMVIGRNQNTDVDSIYYEPSVYATLNEAMGISAECNVEAKRIADKLRSVVNNTEGFSYMTSNGKRIGIIRKGRNTFDVFGKTIIVKWIYYSFNSRKWMDKYYNRIPKSDYFDATNNLLSVSMFGVSGGLDTRNCENTIAHEIFHSYKNFKPVNLKDHELAKMASNVIGIKSNTYETELIGRIMYLLSKEEIQSFCNGAYAQAKKEAESGNIRSIEQFIESTMLYENFTCVDYFINDFKRCVDEMTYDKCRIQINAITKKQMMPYKAFLKYMEDGRKEYIYQIGRLKSMLIDDFKMEESNVFVEKYFNHETIND